MLPDGRVKVYIETPDLKDGFHNATCYLPEYQWEDVNGYSDAEMNYFKEFLRNNAHLIIEFSKEGGILLKFLELILTLYIFGRMRMNR